MASPVNSYEKGQRLIDIVGTQPYLLSDLAENEALELISDGADLTIVNDITGSALCLAAFMGHTRIVQALVDAGADVNAADDMFAMTPLMCAAYTNHAEIVDILITAQAHPLLCDNDSNTALMMANRSKNRNPAIIRSLTAAEDEYRLVHHGVLRQEFEELIERGLPTSRTTRCTRLHHKRGPKP